MATREPTIPASEPGLAAFLDSQYQQICRGVRGIAFRNGFDADEADDLVSWCIERLIDNDFAILRRVASANRPSAFLAVTLSRFAIDYRNRHWGRWRPSAAAQHLGSVAVRLERLCYRDARAFHEAVEILRSEGVRHSEAELRALWKDLPPRAPQKAVALEAAASVGTADDAERSLELEENRTLRVANREALTAALSDLEVEDRIVIQLLYWDRLSIADVARNLRLDQKPLYRRVQGSLSKLRVALKLRGIDGDRIADRDGGLLA